MKRVLNLFVMVAALVVCAVPALAQATECTEDFKTTTYKKYYDNRKDHADIAFQAAEAWMATCPNEDSPYATAIKKYHAAYKAATGADLLKKQFEEAYTKKNYAEQLRIGKQIIAAEPDNPAIYIILGNIGLGDAALLNDSSQYAKKAIEMIEAGKPFAPATSKDQALAYLNYNVGKSLLKSSPTEAIPYILKAAQLESELKKNSQVYVDLASAYGEGPIAKQSEEYKAKYPTETPESKVAFENINQLIDRQIDALARAAALSTNPTNKKAIMDVLAGLYKDRNKSDAGLNEMLASVLSKPVPNVPTPVAAPTPAETPTPAASPAPAGSTAPVASPTPAASPAPAASSTPAASPVPAASPTPKTTPAPKATPTPAASPSPTPKP